MFSTPIPIDKCRRLFAYDPSTGIIVRKMRTGRWLAGSLAGTDKRDYSYVGVDGKRILAHRLAWAIFYGEWPDRPIDHINMDRYDNRISNLRLASVSENNRNRVRQSNNSSGFKGVTRHRASGKFHAKIMADKRRYSLGYFATAKEASEAYEAAARKLHGKFVRIDGGATNG